MDDLAIRVEAVERRQGQTEQVIERLEEDVRATRHLYEQLESKVDRIEDKIDRVDTSLQASLGRVHDALVAAARNIPPAVSLIVAILCAGLGVLGGYALHH